MDSTSLTDRDIGEWSEFSRSSERSLLIRLPSSPGVYVVLFERLQERCFGASDVAYIGKATNKNGLRGRVRQYFHPGPTQSTNIAMKERLWEPSCSLRLGFTVSASEVDAECLESELLILFESEHGELPPFNRQRALRSMS